MTSGQKPIMRTYTGLWVNPLNPKLEEINKEDVAHHLALINRFNGATQRPVPVAQHVVFVSRLCALRAEQITRIGYGKKDRKKFVKLVALKGLHHDDAEAYLGDPTKWLKHSPAMKGYRIAEKRVQALCYEAFDCWVNDFGIIDWADRVMVRFEGLQGWRDRKFIVDNPRYPPLTKDELAMVGKWKPWSWKAAEEAYLTQQRLIENGFI